MQFAYNDWCTHDEMYSSYALIFVRELVTGRPDVSNTVVDGPWKFQYFLFLFEIIDRAGLLLLFSLLCAQKRILLDSS